jgi:uncharacterized protein YndB with AHSA1/START domain
MVERNATHMPADKEMAREVLLTRDFNAKRTRVFKAWIEPSEMAQWWGPHGFTNPVCELDVRPGGAIRIDMQGPDGVVYPMTGTFHEVAEPERLVFTAVAEDETGNALIEAHTTVSFAEREGATTLTVQANGVALQPVGAQMMQGMEEGWSQSLERLGTLVAR